VYDQPSLHGENRSLIGATLNKIEKSQRHDWKLCTRLVRRLPPHIFKQFNNMKVDWKTKEVMNIISNPLLQLDEMCKLLGVTRFYISRKRKEFGLPRICFGKYGHKSSNRERKARYNAKIKLIGYKPLSSIK